MDADSARQFSPIGWITTIYKGCLENKNMIVDDYSGRGKHNVTLMIIAKKAI